MKEVPTPTVGIRQARTQFSRLLTRVAAGEEILITRAGQPVARLVPCPQTGTRQLGMDAGRVVIAADFDGGCPTRPSPIPSDRAHHRDPFDRLLIAQAQIEDLTILTSDPMFDAYDVATLPAA